MKKNGNNLHTGEYYIGLDVGTNSVGWAVTDKEYNILKFKGNAMWGVRLFEEASDAATRRSSRTARRRLARQKQRLLLLQMLFAEEIAKVDPNFFVRMQESSLLSEDKSGDKFSVFADSKYTDREYHKNYPTVYHLRSKLAFTEEPHDVRLVFLAIHHILKSRGHFLYETSESGEYITLDSAFCELLSYIESTYNVKFSLKEHDTFMDTLQRKDLGITAKKKALRATLDASSIESDELSILAVSDMLAGATVSLSELFCDEDLKKSEIKSFCLKNDLEESYDALNACLGERLELLMQMKTVYDAAMLSQILNGHTSISKAKVAQYEKNKKDLRLLKTYVRNQAPNKYKLIFSKRSDKLNNYPAYSRYHANSGAYHCTQEEFCKFLKKELPVPDPSDTEMQRIFREIQDITFLSKLRGSENGVIPYQLHRKELIDILNNASKYLPFLERVDADGISIKEKILKTFEFRIPYYVGPLNSRATNGWAIRFAGKENEQVLPWNFETIVDEESSASKFIENLIGRCTYTGEKVLPKDSLLYSEYMMLNEMNLLRVNGKALPYEVKKKLLDHFFYAARRKVTKKQIRGYLLSEGLISTADEISGIDDTVKASLRSWHDFRDILNRTGDVAMVEDMIRAVLVFGTDKTMLRRWLRKNTHDLTEMDYQHICRLKYSDWGRLSKTLLDEIPSQADQNGEVKTVMDLLRETDQNLMQILYSEYGFLEAAAQHRDEVLGCNQTLSKKLDALYVAPAVRRGILQTLRIVDETVDIRKAAPAKIFVEMARGSKEEMKNKRTESRKSKLQALYKACKEESGYLFEKLEKEDDNSLRSDKLYLYYLQLGKCMYSGESIDLESLLHGERYDIDHIFPRSRIKDNSLDNRVLVKSELNREKTNIYPISENIRHTMLPAWTWMKENHLISQKKFDRLSRNYPLTEKELSDFVARQLTETQQSTKALATLLKNTYTDTRIVYSKAGNVSDFRHEFDLLKCREVNDLHHAKDAYLNIVVGNVYCTKFTERFFANIEQENYSLNCVFAYDTAGAWDKTESIKTVKRYMAKNNVLVTRVPHEVKGQLFDLQILPAGKGQLPKKEGLPVEKYGGYNKLTGACFFAVEYTDKKKRVRSLQPVYVYKKDLFEKDPVKYCETVLDLKDPKIIVPKIRMDSLLELDGKRLYVSGRTGSRLLCEHSYQLAIEYTWEKYIRNLCKYVERCDAKKLELPVTVYDGLTYEKNESLYDCFLSKCEQTIYADFVSNMKADLIQHRAVFDAMSMLPQCRILLEILKAFRCNALNPNFTSLCGKGSVAQVLRSMNLSNYSGAYLINQSVTGLYEVKVDLLR